MDDAERLEILLSENELLQLELDDLRTALAQKERELDRVISSYQTPAALQSRIDANLVEIEQLKYNIAQAAQRTEGIETLNEELELSLLKETRDKQREQATVKSLGSVHAELQVVTTELEEAVPLYGKAAALEDSLAEASSRIELLQLENTSLQQELTQFRDLFALMKNKKGPVA